MRGGQLERIETRVGHGLRRSVHKRTTAGDEASQRSALLEHAPGALVLMGLDSRISQLSGVLLGHAAKHWVGRRLSEGLGAEASRLLADSLGRLTPGAAPSELELPVRTPRGEARTIRLRLARLGSEAETASQAVSAFISDVTAELGREQELRSREVLSYRAQKSALLSFLAGGVAHDFNNLLTVIGGGAGLLEDDPRIPADLREEVSQIRHAGERATEITRQLLVYSRREPSLARTLRLSEALAGLEPLLTRLLGTGICLELSAAADLWDVNVDPLHVEHVVTQLALQARQTMPVGGVLWLALENRRIDAFEKHGGSMVGPGQYVELCVRDTGAGLNEAAVAHAFEPFFAAQDGTGTLDLGLPFVRHLVVHAFGHVWVESEPGRGSVFTVLWPRAGERSTQPAVAAPSTAPSKLSSAPSSAPPTAAATRSASRGKGSSRPRGPRSRH